MGPDTYCVYDTSIRFHNNTEQSVKNWYCHKFRHYGYFYRILNMLASCGFAVQKDPNVGKHIRKHYFIGKCGDLEFRAEKYQRGFSIEFFQNVNFENPNGGYYDFDKFDRMPYPIRLRYMKYRNKIIAMLKKLVPDIEDISDVKYCLAEDKIKNTYVRSVHYPQTNMNFDLHDLDGQTSDTYNSKDRNGKIIHNGEVKYFRNRQGYLCRGRVYHDLNNMWMVILNTYTITKVAAFELFDLTPDDIRTRFIVDGRVPIKVQRRWETLSEVSTKELKAELKRRGVKI